MIGVPHDFWKWFLKYEFRRKKSLPIGKLLIYLVPGGGIEPPWSCPRWILSPVRLPIPPPRQRKNEIITNTGIYANYWIWFFIT